MLSGPVYFTPTELLTRAPLGSIPRLDIPGPQFKGKIGPVAHLGASTGTIEVGGFPIDAKQMVIRVAAPGDLGTARFEFSDDGGSTFGDFVLSDLNQVNNTTWDYEIGITGLVLTARNGTAPSFLLGDTWTLTTTASAKLLQICGTLSDYYRKWALNTGQPVTDIDEADRDMLCHIGRMWLVAGRGDVPEFWVTLYREAKEHFKLEALGDLKQNSLPDPDGFVWPDYEQVRPPFHSGVIAAMH